MIPLKNEQTICIVSRLYRLKCDIYINIDRKFSLKTNKQLLYFINTEENVRYGAPASCDSACKCVLYVLLNLTARLTKFSLDFSIFKPCNFSR